MEVHWCENQGHKYYVKYISFGGWGIFSRGPLTSIGLIYKLERRKKENMVGPCSLELGIF